MMPGHAGGLEHDGRVGIASDQVRASSEQRAPAGSGDSIQSDASITAIRVQFASKCVADAVNSANELRVVRILGKRPSNFADQVGQVGLDNERIRPQVIVKLGLR